MGSMKSMPALSAMRARRKQSGQLADQRSGTLVAERPDEQFAPKTPILSALALYMAMRSSIAAVRANKAFSIMCSQSIFRKKPAPDLIRGGYRFSAENAINSRS